MENRNNRRIFALSNKHTQTILTKNKNLLIMATITYPTFSDLMGCNSYARFQNEQGEIISIGSGYDKNTLRITVTFRDTKDFVNGGVARRGMITSTSEKKIAKLIVDGGYKKI